MTALVAAGVVGAAVASVSLLIVRPTLRLGPRVAPYIQRSRQQLGGAADPTLLLDTAPPQGVWKPMLDAAARRLSNMLDAGGTEALAQRLRHAGWRDMTPEQYRMGQLTSTLTGIGALTLVALVVTPSAGSVLLGVILGAIAGASRWRSRIDKAVTRRRDQLRAELAAIAELLAMRISIGTAPMVAVSDLARRARGPVAQDLGDAVAWVQDGTPVRLAFEQLAAQTPEPTAERLYRLLGTAEAGTGPALTSALTAAAKDLRAQQREDLERAAVRRNFAMLVPTVLLMGPVMLLFLAAPIPTLIFGD